MTDEFDEEDLAASMARHPSAGKERGPAAGDLIHLVVGPEHCVPGFVVTAMGTAVAVLLYSNTTGVLERHIELAGRAWHLDVGAVRKEPS